MCFSKGFKSGVCCRSKQGERLEEQGLYAHFPFFTPDHLLGARHTRASISDLRLLLLNPPRIHQFLERRSRLLVHSVHRPVIDQTVDQE